MSSGRFNMTAITAVDIHIVHHGLSVHVLALVNHMDMLVRVCLSDKLSHFVNKSLDTCLICELVRSTLVCFVNWLGR